MEGEKAVGRRTVMKFESTGLADTASLASGTWSPAAIAHVRWKLESDIVGWDFLEFVVKKEKKRRVGLEKIIWTRGDLSISFPIPPQLWSQKCACMGGNTDRLEKWETGTFNPLPPPTQICFLRPSFVQTLGCGLGILFEFPPHWEKVHVYCGHSPPMKRSQQESSIDQGLAFRGRAGTEDGSGVEWEGLRDEEDQMTRTCSASHRDAAEI